MPVEAKNLVLEELLELLLHGNKSEIRDFLNDQYSQDLAETIETLNDADKLSCFLLLDLEHTSDVLAELSSETQNYLLQVLGSKKLAPIISQMDSDDAADLINELDTEDKTNLLEILPDPIHQAHVQELINYPAKSAGGIMSTDFLRLRSDMTIQIALNYVRRHAAQEQTQIYYLYVVDNTNKLVGVISLRNLIIASLSDIVANHMSTEILTCNVDDDQETVAHTIAKYDLIAVPIIDKENKLKGIVTVDDVVDILKEETTEDIYQSSGITQETEPDKLISGQINYALKARFPWLLLTLVGEVIAVFIISYHEKSIISAPIAISFMPLLSGLSGNVGGQTSTIVVRGLVTGDIDLKNTFKYILRELKIGFLLGLICSFITGAFAWMQYGTAFLGIVVAFSLTVTMSFGVLLGTAFPILLQYLKKDPAAASSPFITTILDIFTFSFYLTMVSLTLKHIN
ncbi:MAG: magnesium transporter [Candidatus Melainabacteria bacterium]|nr:magnesium transporter [Candidatus Melainabacteria bacterium]MBI3309053.1 magnesium transporter [Candidatus Melainabacteria bacterium]